MNRTSHEQILEWLGKRENEHLEFKEAKERYDFEELVKYCAALSNEKGGSFILGVTDAIPRRIVGTNAFHEIERTQAGLTERLGLKIEAEESSHDGKRLLIFHVPSRPIGVPIQYKGAFWMRSGDSLVEMTVDQIKRILDESCPDFSAEICRNAKFEDLSPEAIENFRQRWIAKSGNKSLATIQPAQLLKDAELIVDTKITYAALVLFGSKEALGKLLAQAEIVFEYRSSDASGPAQQRIDYREGFFLVYDKIWETINLRNDKQHYQDGLFVLDIPTFSERTVREALLNAISHREYRMAGSIFVRQYPRRLEIVSTGGFPDNVNQNNILWVQSPRNRRIAEALARCGIVERSGQGADLMFQEAICQSKPLPDYSRSDRQQVFLILRGEIQDEKFLRFLEKVGLETMKSFSTEHFLALDCIHKEKPVPESCRDVIPHLVELGVIEKIGRGRGTRYMLSHRFYTMTGKKGQYTRRKGLDRETNKTLLLKHVERCRDDGAKLAELLQVLPSESRNTVQKMLFELKEDGKVKLIGKTSAGRWHVGN